MMIFNKVFKNKDYELYFNSLTGVEMLRGANGKPDPFYLELPSLIDIGVMGTCKHKCYFCYQGHINRPNMKLEDYKRIIDQVKHHTNQVALGGRGDPNFHENFKEIIEYSRKNGVTPNYTTSGIGLTDEHVEISKLCGAVAVSDYDQDYTYDAIDKFIKAGVKTNIHLIFNKRTFEKCTKILHGHNPWKRVTKYLVDVDKLNAVIFLLFKAAGAGKDLWEIIPGDYEFEIFADLIFKPKSKFKVGMDSCLVNHVINYTEPSKVQEMYIDTCEGARMSAYITPDMKLLPCSFATEDKLAQWSVAITQEKDIYTIWNHSKQFKDFRKELKLNGNICPLGL